MSTTQEETTNLGSSLLPDLLGFIEPYLGVSTLIGLRKVSKASKAAVDEEIDRIYQHQVCPWLLNHERSEKEESAYPRQWMMRTCCPKWRVGLQILPSPGARGTRGFRKMIHKVKQAHGRGRRHCFRDNPPPYQDPHIGLALTEDWKQQRQQGSCSYSFEFHGGSFLRPSPVRNVKKCDVHYWKRMEDLEQCYRMRSQPLLPLDSHPLVDYHDRTSPLQDALLVLLMKKSKQDGGDTNLYYTGYKADIRQYRHYGDDIDGQQYSKARYLEFEHSLTFYLEDHRRVVWTGYGLYSFYN